MTTSNTSRPVANGAIRLKIGYADTLSGVSSVEYRIDTGAWQLYFNAVAFKGDAMIDVPGDHTIAVRATDVAGNVSPERALDFTVKTDPSAIIQDGSQPILQPVAFIPSSTTVASAASPAPSTAAGTASTTTGATTTTTTQTATTIATIASTPVPTPLANTPTIPSPTVIATATQTPQSGGILGVSNATQVGTTTATTVPPTATATLVVTTPTTVPATVSATPNQSATPSRQAGGVTTTPSTTAAATVTTTPSPSVKLVAPSCSDAAVRSVASCTAVTITNAGTTDLRITNMVTSGEFLIGDAGSTCTAALAPTASCAIPILFIPTTIGKRLGSLTVTDNAPDSPHTITLTGNGIGAPAVAFAPPLFTCPDTQIGDTSNCSVTLTNTGSAELTIASGIVVTGDFSPDPANTDCRQTLAVSAHCAIAVLFAPTVHGIRTGVLTLTDTAPGSPQPISLTGKGLAPAVTLAAGLVISPSSIVCQDTDVGKTGLCPPLPPQSAPDTKPPPLTLTNTGDGVLTVTSIIPHDDFIKIADVANCVTTLQPQQSCALHVTFAPLDRGTHVSSLTISDNVPGGPQTVQVVGKGLAPVVNLSASSLTCLDTTPGTVGVIVGHSSMCGTSLTPTFTQLTLTNTGDAALNISSILPNDPFLTIGTIGSDGKVNLPLVLPTDVPPCPTGLPISAACQVTIPIVFSPTARGSFTSGLTFTDDAADSPQTVQITAKALAPVVQLGPLSVACPPTPVGLSTTACAPATVTLKNSGDSPLNIASIVPSSDFTSTITPVALNTTCLAVIQPNVTCQIAITFAPTVVGLHQGNLTISDDALGSPHTIQLTGFGQAPVVRLSPTSLSCGPTDVGAPPVTCGSGPLTLTNTGDAPLNISSIVPEDSFLTVVNPTTPTIVPPCPASQPISAVCQLSITVNFAPTGRGIFISGLTITDNAANGPQSVEVVATGNAPVFSLNAASLTCPDTDVGLSTAACTPSTLTLTNTGTAVLNIASIVPGDDFTIGTQCGATLGPNLSCTLQVTFAPTVAGVHQSNLTFNDNAPGSPHTVQLTAKGRAPVVTLSSASLACPNTVVGQTAPCAAQPITLANSGDAVLKISGIVPNDDFIKVDVSGCPALLPAGQNCALPISFAPTRRGTFTSGITITDNALGSPRTIQLTATGLAPVVSLTPASLALTCPDTPVGQTTACTPATITLTNAGDATLVIASIVPSNDFKVGVAPSGTNCGATLTAGATCTLQITFAPTVAGLHEGNLVFNDTAPNSPQTIQMTAKGLAPIATLNATALTCPNAIVGQTTTCTPQPLILTNTGDAPLTISSFAPADDFWVTPTGSGCAATIAPNGTCQLQVIFVPTKRGNHTAALSIMDNAAGSPQTVQLAGTAFAPVVTLSPATIACPDTAVGQSTSACTPATVTLQNSGDAPLNIASIVPSDDFTVVAPATGTACGTTLAASATCSLQVVFTPKRAGNHLGSVAFTDNAPGSPHAVQLTGNAIAPVISLSTQSVACGGAPVGTTVTCPVFTLANTGTSPLAISSIVLDGDFTAAITPNSCGTTVQPNVTPCQITVTFGPTAGGSRTGSLTITDNAPGSPHAISLLGTGQLPVLSLSATSISCPDTAIGVSAPCTSPVTLTNTGDAPLTIGSIIPSDDFRAPPAQCPVTLAAGANCQVAVSFKPMTSGSHVGSLTISDTAAGSPHRVQLTGNGLAPVLALSTQSISCTATLVGTAAACPAVTFTNSGNAALTIRSIVLSGDFGVTITQVPGGSPCGSVLQPASVCQITTTFSPTVAGGRNGSVTISDDANGSPHSIALAGTGQAPVVSLSASSPCPNTAVGSSANCGSPMTLTNTGDAALTLGSITANDDFKIAAPGTGTGCTTSLAAGASCLFQVVFAPTTSGNHTGAVTIVDNAAGSPHSAQVTGVGLAPVVSLTPSVVSCPDTQIGSTNPCSGITLKNTGNTALTWTSLTANSPYSVGTSTCVGNTLAAGSTCQITVTFAPGTGGVATGFLTIADNAPGSPHTVTLTGNGVGTPALTLTQAGSCPDTAVGTTAPCSLLVTVANGSSATGNLVMSLITISSEFGIDTTRSTCGTILTPGNNCVLAINFTPALDGQRGGTVTITDNAAGSPQSVTLTGKGLGTPRIAFGAPSLTCPGTLVGTTASCPPGVTVSNPGTAALTISQVSISGEFALDTLTNSTCGTTVAPGASCTLSISFSPTATGTRSGTLQITDNVSGTTPAVTLTGTGTRPAIAFAPAAIACPDTIVASRTICSTTVTNTGTAPMTMSSAITAGGTDYVIDTTGGGSCGATLAAGASCTLSVGFTPTVTGARPGTLTVTDNAPGSPHAVALSGTGTQPAVTLSTPSITCADTATGATGACPQISLTNSGTATLTITLPFVTTDVFATGSTTCTSSLAVGASCSISINFLPTSSFTGARTGTLKITDNAPNSPQTVNLAGMGVASAPPVSFSPASPTCTTTGVGATGTCQLVTLKNNGATSVTVNASTSAAGDVAVGSTTCSGSLAAGATCTLTVTFTPTATGTRTGTVTLTYGTSPQTTIVVRYSGTGT
ncbi:MAG: choice-of-anchor D domain-containing protein [Thermomicrobiales bacterium]